MTGFFSVPMIITAILIMAVIFINGWTDAPNAVSTVIASGAMSARAAINMAAVCNLAGLTVMSIFNRSVAENIFSSVRLNGGQDSLCALCSAMISIVIFSVAAWYFGIPTSESHALLAALGGAAVALKGGVSSINFAVWEYALAGLIFTTVSGFVLGYINKKAADKAAAKINRKVFVKTQKLLAGLLAFVHGAQDGQKFAAVFMLGIALSSGRETNEMPVSFPVVLLCAGLMAAGTAVGGGRIIKRVGTSITKIDDAGSVACDTASFFCMLTATLAGMPVSTTHTKTTAVLGVGAANKNARYRSYFAIFAVWMLTFPACFIIGYFVTKLCLQG